MLRFLRGGNKVLAPIWHGLGRPCQCGRQLALVLERRTKTIYSIGHGLAMSASVWPRNDKE